MLVDVAGIEPATPCLQSKHKFNLSRCFGCAYYFQALLRLLQSCSKKPQSKAASLFRTATGNPSVNGYRGQKSKCRVWCRLPKISEPFSPL